VSDPTPPPLSLVEIATTWPRPDTCLVRLAGELDMSNAPVVRLHLSRQAAAQHLVLDLSAVKLISAAGISVLITAMPGDDGVRGRVHVVAPAGGTARRMLRLTGVDTVLRVHLGVDEALEAVDAGPA
jgi:anti-anti-sigma factor